MARKKERRFNPLGEDEARRFDDAAQDSEKPLKELAARGILHTGLRNGTFCHTAPSWLEVIEDRCVIKVPWEEECTSGSGAYGEGNEQGGNLHERGVPCANCRDNENGRWLPKTENTPRTIPVMETEIYDLFEWWFRNNDQIPILHNAVNSRLREVADEAGLRRDVTAHDLRHTYGTMLARMDFTAPQIRDVMGHGSLKMPLRYIDFTGVRKVRTFEEKWDF